VYALEKKCKIIVSYRMPENMLARSVETPIQRVLIFALVRDALLMACHAIQVRCLVL